MTNASSYMGKYLRISSYIRKPFLICDFATAPLWISLYTIWEKFSFLFYQCTFPTPISLHFSPPPPSLHPSTHTQRFFLICSMRFQIFLYFLISNSLLSNSNMLHEWYSCQVSAVWQSLTLSWQSSGLPSRKVSYNFDVPFFRYSFFFYLFISINSGIFRTRLYI